jgi:hypothetical protein
LRARGIFGELAEQDLHGHLALGLIVSSLAEATIIPWFAKPGSDLYHSKPLNHLWCIRRSGPTDGIA